MMARLLLCFAILLGALSAHAKPCRGLQDIPKKQGDKLEDVVKAIQVLLNNSASPPMDCASLTLVADRAINGRKKLGTELEGGKPLDRVEAQANRDKAMRDPEIRARIEQLNRDVPDENVRFLLEAAILDEEGYYSARDLRIQQLQERLK